MTQNRKQQPVVLAVTGHRNIDPRDKNLEKKIASECDRLRKLYPEETFLILSGLAEGADRLVAKVAMKKLDAKLIAVLAVPEESFVMDFATTGSRKIFRNLLQKSQTVLTAPLLTRTAWKDYSPARNHQYAWEGAFIARHADILIAIWDGQPARGVGGTADVVKWFQNGKIPKQYLEESDELARSAGIPKKKIGRRREFIHITV